MLFSSGVIAGEALTAVALAGLAALQIMGIELPISAGARMVVSLIAAAVAVIVFVIMCRPQESGADMHRSS